MNDIINRYGMCRVDRAEKLVDKIIEDFTDRCGFDDVWSNMDWSTKLDLKYAWRKIILEWEDDA